ncbi:phage head closure protein [Pseudomonas luteola]|uniref:phage head closure protein n=1 Tax=Pseudomonas luteola TaxID=47886 RepID=UPI003A8A225E
MRAGKLNHLLTIQKVQRTQDRGGGFVETWVDMGKEWASVESISGREYLAAAALQAQTTWKITLRYRDDLLNTMRLVEGSRIYEIEAVLPNDSLREVVLMCKTS